MPNYNLETIHTVLDGDHFAQLLREAYYDEQEVKFLRNGFTQGFKIGYEGPTDRQEKAHNIQRSCGAKTDLWNKMIKEVNLKRFAGPFTSIPYDRYIQLPTGLVPKGQGQGQTRLIFHLSWPVNDSVNFHMPRDKCTLKYKDLDEAVQLFMEVINEAAHCFMAKSDMKSAFRHLPIRKQYWRWLVLIARHPKTNEKFYFIDKNVPFGASISCSHFQRVSNGIEAIFRHRT